MHSAQTVKHHTANNRMAFARSPHRHRHHQRCCRWRHWRRRCSKMEHALNECISSTHILCNIKPKYLIYSVSLFCSDVQRSVSVLCHRVAATDTRRDIASGRYAPLCSFLIPNAWEHLSDTKLCIRISLNLPGPRSPLDPVESIYFAWDFWHVPILD